LLLLAYTDQTLARAAADVIRGWAKEDPRALWERLKAEGPVRAPEPREVARWSVVRAGSRPATLCFRGTHKHCYRGTHKNRDAMDGFYPNRANMVTRLDALPELPARLMPDASEVDPRELARWARILTSNRLVNPDPVTWTNTGDGGYRFGGDFADPVERLAEGWDLPELPAKVSPGAEAVDPREVARWAFVAGAAFVQGDPSTAYAGDPGANGGRMGDVRTRVSGRLDDLPELPATVLVEAVEPPRLPEGSWVYIDPPYQGTTGYAHDLPREEVVRLARLWREAGAHVCISEAEPIPDLVAEGWYVVEITGDRKGQKRTFSKQKREFLTMSREPRGQLGFWGLS
jgi:hypothetical protein